MYLPQKLSKYVTLSPPTYETIPWVPIDLHSSRFIVYVWSFISSKLFLEKKPIKFGLILIRSLHLIINQRMSWHWKSFTALIFFPQLLLILVLDSMLSLPYLLTHFSNKAAFGTPNIILINSFCCYFDLFSVESLTNFYQ